MGSLARRGEPAETRGWTGLSSIKIVAGVEWKSGNRLSTPPKGLSAGGDVRGHDEAVVCRHAGSLQGLFVLQLAAEGLAVQAVAHGAAVWACGGQFQLGRQFGDEFFHLHVVRNFSGTAAPRRHYYGY